MDITTGKILFTLIKSQTYLLFRQVQPRKTKYFEKSINGKYYTATMK